MPPIAISLKTSSNIKSATFNAEDGTMDVVFDGGGGGGSYRYKNVTQKLVDEFSSSASPGKWFAKAIKEKVAEFPFEKLGDSAPAAATATTASAPIAMNADAAASSTEPASVAPAPAPLAIDETKVSPDILASAEGDYIAYCANSNNLNYRGEQCPAWKDLTSAVRSHWCAVATRNSKARVSIVAEFERVKAAHAKLESSTGSVDQRKVDAAVAEKTAALTTEMDELRGKHAAIEAENAQLRKGHGDFAPWKKG